MNAPLPGSVTGSTVAAHPIDALELLNSFARLSPQFYSRVQPAPLPDPYWIAGSAPAAALIGLHPGELGRPAARDILAGNAPLSGGEPIAAVYSGHQFGVWAGQLGDGRALLLGEARGPDGDWEIQLKGAGKTPYSRMGDGRAVLRSSIREFLCSEAMHALGIPTTRALAIVGSDQPVLRENVETAAVVTRLAPSFVRFGSFEHFSAAGRPEALRELADHVIDRFYPALRSGPQPYAALLGEATRRTARLIARWQAVGFCHGVMNTDNMSILGLTIDYGPFGFLDAFDAHHVCNHSDTGGRYSYAQQPGIGEWNCYALGQALVPLIGDPETAQAELAAYRPAFAQAFDAQMRAKLGLVAPDANDEALLNELFTLLHRSRADFTIFFRKLAGVRADAGPGAPGDAALRDLCIDPLACDAWLAAYRRRLALQQLPDAARAAAMNRVNPKYVLRNHLAEAAIRAATGDGGGRDFSEIERLRQLLSRPYDEQPGYDAYAAPPPEWAAGIEVSCSS